MVEGREGGRHIIVIYVFLNTKLLVLLFPIYDPSLRGHGEAPAFSAELSCVIVFGRKRRRFPASPKCPTSSQATTHYISQPGLHLQSNTTIPEYHSIIVLQYYSTIVPQCHSITVPQYHSTTVLQYHSTTVLQYHSTTVL